MFQVMKDKKLKIYLARAKYIFGSFLQNIFVFENIDNF